MFYLRLSTILILFLSLFSSCKNGKNIIGEDKFAGTRQMIDSLKAIYKRTDFVKHPYEKTEYIAMLKKKFAEQPNQDPMSWIEYALELSKGGEIDNSIKVLEELKSKVPFLQNLNQQNKMFYDLLAVNYMRKGEVENCAMNHNSESCLFPIKGQGIHKLTTGSTEAIKIYQQILDAFPDDLQSKYILNVAYTTLGKYPNEVPEKYLIPAGKLESHGKMAKFENIAGKLGFNIMDLSGGVIVDDFDNDGFKDIMVSSWGLNDQIRFYKNMGDGRFEDHTQAAGLIGLTGGLNLKQADYNNDGNLDFFIMRGSWKKFLRHGIQPNSLIRNNGDGTFSDVTIQAGLYTVRPTQTAEFFDYNNDGLLDLFVGNETVPGGETFPCEFYVNKGDGTFTNVATKYRMDVVAFVKGVSSSDYNNDGLPDLYLSIIGGPNRLFINKGGHTIDDWVFENGEDFAEVTKPVASFPCWFFDVNNDGYEDIFTSAFDSTAYLSQAHEYVADKLGLKVVAELPKLFINNHDGTFKDQTVAYGLNHPFGTMGSNYGDLDNDGFLDFYLGTGAPDYRAILPNRMFHNINGQRFEEVTTATNTGHLQKGHAVSFSDLDNDGDNDIYANMGGAVTGDKFQDAIFENPGNDNQWIVLLCQGTKSNRSALGAKIKISLLDEKGNNRTVYKTVTSGGSFGANSLEQLVGLGKIKEVQNIEVKFPNGENKFVSFGALKPGHKYHLVEGSTIAKEMPYKKIDFSKIKDGPPHKHVM